MTFSGLLDKTFRQLTASFVQFKYKNGVNEDASPTDGRGFIPKSDKSAAKYRICCSFWPEGVYVKRISLCEVHVSSPDMMMVTPVNDLQGWEPGSMVKGERLMRCKLASAHRLFDLFGWAQIGHTCLTVSPAGRRRAAFVANPHRCVVLLLRQLRVNKEQEHFLVLPEGLAYSEATGSGLVGHTRR